MRNKRFLLLICIGIMLCAALTVFADAAVEISVGTLPYSSDASEQTVDVPITLSGNTDGITGLALSISYDSGITLTNVTRGSALSDMTMTPGGDISADPYNITWDTLDADTTNGTIVILTFSVPASSEKDYSINATVLSIYDFDMNDIEHTVTNGKLTAAGDAVFEISNADVRPGETVKLVLSLTSFLKVNSIAVSKLEYDKELLEFVGFGDYNAIEGTTALPPVFDNEQEYFLIALSEAVAFDGVLCTLEFKVKEDAYDTVTAISATPLLKYDSDVIGSVVNDNEVTIRTYIKGDIDGDEDVDLDDAVYLFGSTMLPQYFPTEYRGNMDFNKDGYVDLKDAVLLFNYSMIPDVYPID